MKKFYTSNYARNSENPMSLAISAKPPVWYHGIRAPELAPTWDILNAYHDDTVEYEKAYYEMLKSRGLTPKNIVDRYNDGSIFLCYESPDDFCHRQLFARWVNASGLATIEEILTDREKAAKNQKKYVDNVLQFK